MCASVCVCGTDVVVLCAGLPAGTEDVTAAAAGRGGDVRHDLGGGVHLTGGTTFERGGSEPEGGWLYVGL